MSENRHKNCMRRAKMAEEDYTKEGAIYKILAILQDGIILHLTQNDQRPIHVSQLGWTIDEELEKAVQEFIKLNK